MDRIFLAVIVSGLLLAATSMSLLAATGGGTMVAALKVPPPAVSISSMRPYRPQHDTVLAREDSTR
jgi:hypothetical protein